MGRGAAAREKNGANNLAKHDREQPEATDPFSQPIRTINKKRVSALAQNVHKKISRKGLDSKGSFRDGPGGPGRLPARGSHRPERAQLTHSVPQATRSLYRDLASVVVNPVWAIRQRYGDTQ